MRTIVATLSILIIFYATVPIAHAQDMALSGESAVLLGFGMWNGPRPSTSVSLTGLSSMVKLSGFTGRLVYAHWLHENTSLNLSAGLIAAQTVATAGVSGDQEQASVVIPILLGVKYYVPNPAPGDAIRPYLFVAGGVFVGVEAKNTPAMHDAHSEGALGGQLGGGVDFLLSHRFMLGAHVGYNVMTDFDTPVASRRNYNGADASLEIGFIF